MTGRDSGRCPACYEGLQATKGGRRGCCTATGGGSTTLAKSANMNVMPVERSPQLRTRVAHCMRGHSAAEMPFRCDYTQASSCLAPYDRASGIVKSGGTSAGLHLHGLGGQGTNWVIPVPTEDTGPLSIAGLHLHVHANNLLHAGHAS